VPDLEVNVNFSGFDGIEAAIDQSAPQILREMGRAAVGHLADLDSIHPYLATQWDSTEPEQTGAGWSTTVWSHAEDQTFYDAGWDQNGNRVQRDPRFPVSGKMLLTILELGAKEHEIPARNAELLRIPMPGTEARTAMFTSRYGVKLSQLDNRSNFVAQYRRSVRKEAVQNYVQTPLVEDHPGLAGNDNVLATDEWMQEQVSAWGEEAAQQIEVVLAR
jgi:hypothetical protein